MAEFEKRIKRLPGLEKWFVEIPVNPTEISFLVRQFCSRKPLANKKTWLFR